MATTLVATCPKCNRQFEVEPSSSMRGDRLTANDIPLPLRLKTTAICAIVSVVLIVGGIKALERYALGRAEPFIQQSISEIMSGEVPQSVLEHGSAEQIMTYRIMLEAATPAQRREMGKLIEERMRTGYRSRLVWPAVLLAIVSAPFALIGAALGYWLVAGWVHRRRMRRG